MAAALIIFLDLLVDLEVEEVDGEVQQEELELQGKEIPVGEEQQHLRHQIDLVEEGVLVLLDLPVHQVEMVEMEQHLQFLEYQ